MFLNICLHNQNSTCKTTALTSTRNACDNVCDKVCDKVSESARHEQISQVEPRLLLLELKNAWGSSSQRLWVIYLNINIFRTKLAPAMKPAEPWREREMQGRPKEQEKSEDCNFWLQSWKLSLTSFLFLIKTIQWPFPTIKSTQLQSVKTVSYKPAAFVLPLKTSS